MKTLVATISVGPREQLRKFSFPRLKNWGEKHGYTVVLIDRPLQDGGRTPHYAKLRVPQAFPDFDRYCIVDDDLLISSVAPALPDIPAGKVGLVPDAEQRNTTRRDVKWTGNTGFILLRKTELHLLSEAYEQGDDPEIWGVADQGALNSVLWRRDAIHELDRRWNCAPALEYFVQNGGWERWRTSRLYRLSFYAKVVLRYNRWGKMVRNCWGCHLIRASYPRFFNLYIS